jgi:hypothetical protein
MFEIVVLLFPLSGIAFPIYILVFIKLILAKRKNYSIFDLNSLFFFLLAFYVIIKAFNTSFDALFYILTYYFGFLFFFIYFRLSGNSINLSLILKVLCFEVLIEALLINTVLPASLLFNYPPYLIDSSHHKLFFGFFQRPYSIGANASVTSTLILILYIFVKTNVIISFKYEILVLCAIVICLSGTGIALYFIYLTLRYFQPRFKSIALFTSLLFFAYLIVLNLEESDFSKFSSVYLNELYELKIDQINDYLLKLNDTFQIVFGKNHRDKVDVITFNDFAMNDAFYNLGIIGLVLLLCFIISNTNRNNKLMVIYFLVAALHYGAIFNIFGQFLLGYILSFTKTTRFAYS